MSLIQFAAIWLLLLGMAGRNDHPAKVWFIMVSIGLFLIAVVQGVVG